MTLSPLNQALTVGIESGCFEDAGKKGGRVGRVATNWSQRMSERTAEIRRTITDITLSLTMVLVCVALAGGTIGLSILILTNLWKWLVS